MDTKIKLKFLSLPLDLQQGVAALKKRYRFEEDETGIPIEIAQAKGQLSVSCDGRKGKISYHKAIHFFRGLGLLLENLHTSKEFNISEEPQFETSGIMLDMSRNAVLKVENIKDFIEYMAIMGLNTLMLYTEETYELEGEPYFGHLRGRYSKGELQYTDRYAQIFGIEVIPCLQVLGHMERFLQWNEAKKYADTQSVMLIGDEQVYQLIEKIVAFSANTFQSRRIHVGMDEAHDLGLGKYLKLNGYKAPYTLLQSHLKRVKEITDQYGLEPMMWSDMYFRLATATGDYYEKGVVIPKDVSEQVPDNVGMVYWDYYHDDKEFYEDYIKLHNTLGRKPIFAGGIWIWTSVTANYTKTFSSTNAALTACKENGVNEVVATLWMNTGTGCFYSALLGMQLYAEHTYAKDLDQAKLRNRVKFCTDIDFDDYMKLDKLDNIDGLEMAYREPPNPSYGMLWQDVLLGMYDKEMEGLEVAEYYAGLADELAGVQVDEKIRHLVFDVPQKTCEILSIKGDMGIRLRKAYQSGDKPTIDQIANVQIPKLVQLFDQLHDSHRKMWFLSCKSFGFEVQDLRYGGAKGRLETVRMMLNDYLSGKSEEILELAETPLPYFVENADEYALNWTKYSKIITPARLD